MRKIQYLVLVTLMLMIGVTRVCADVVNQKFTVNGLTYTITAATSPNFTVNCTAVSTDALDGDNNITVPATVVHGDITYTVKDFKANPGFIFNELTLSEGIEKISYELSGNAHSSKVLNLPASFVGFVNSSVTYNLRGTWSYRAYNLETINVAADNPIYSSMDGILYNKTKTELLYIPMKNDYVDADGRFTVPDGVEILNWYNYSAIIANVSMSRFGKLKILSIPASLTAIHDIGTGDNNAASNAEVPRQLQRTSKNLAAYEVRGANAVFSAVDGVLFNLAGDTIWGYPRAKTGASYTIPAGVTTISSYAFTGNSNLTTITGGAGVTTIEANAFDNMDNLETLDLSQTQITSLPVKAIYNCKNLTTILLPGTVSLGKLIEDGVIEECQKLDLSTIPADDPLYSVDENAVLYDKTHTRLIYCNETYAGDTDGKYEIPATVTKIEQYAFVRSQLKEVAFAAGSVLDSIGRFAFHESLLESIAIPASIRTIEAHCFHSCKKLASMTFEDISADALLKEIPDTFALGCTALTSLTVPESVTRLGKFAFTSTGLTSFVIPDSVRTMFNAFYTVPHLETLHVGKKVKQLGTGGDFFGTPIQTLTFSEDAELTTIPSIFMYLSVLTLPKSVETVNNLYGSSITKIVIPEGSHLKTLIPNHKTTLETIEGLEYCTEMTTISNNAFADYAKLQELHFPGSITTLGKRAFDGCANLTSLTFGTASDPAQITAIGEAALANCGITTFEVPASVLSIGKEAFEGCTGLQEVTIGAAATSIHAEAFKGCTSLRAFHVDENNTKYADVIGFLTDKAKTTLMIYPQGKSTGTGFTLMPPSLTAIGSHAFYKNDQVQKVIIPANVTSIGDFAFLHDTGLRSLIFMGSSLIDPDNIKQGINDMAFDYPGISEAITDNIMDDITICLTQSAYAEWVAAQAEGAGNKYYDYYSKFKGVETTFTVDHLGSTEQDEFMPVGENEASLLTTASTVTSYVLPTAVNHNSKDYAVTMICDFAFENASSNIKEVVVKGTPQYIGSQAFSTQLTRDGSGNVTGARSSIENIVFVSSTPSPQLSSVEFDLTNNYNEFLTDIDGHGTAQKIYVKRSAKDAYKTAWAKYAAQIETDLPMKSITNEYATFSREFDVDINPKSSTHPEGENWNDAKDCPKIIAYTSGYYHQLTDEDVFVHMESINAGEGADVDGTYIPANTGVLLQSTDGSLDGLVYTIGELDKNSYAGDNLMQPITGRSKAVTAADASNTNFYVSGGKLWKVPDLGVNMPLHTSYLSVNVPTNARVFFAFGDENTTDIKNVESAAAADDTPAYNLSGQRVGKDYKGLVVKEGKKMLRK